MRFFERSEIIRHKCYVCGSKNKLVTYLMYNTKRVGYTLRCCNCGHVDTFVHPWSHGSMKEFVNGNTAAGTQKCVQESFCPFRKCPYYGTYPVKPETSENKPTCCNNDCKNCTINYCSHKNNISTDTSNKILDCTKLHVKTCNEPDYK